MQSTEEWLNKPLSELVELGTKLLTEVSDSAKLDAQILLCLAIDKPTSYLLTWPEKTLSAANLNEYRSLLTERQQGKPIAYITGYKEFWSLLFEVSPATLIPRPDTETLVELVLDLIADDFISDDLNEGNTQLPKNILDLGTGTGAIALALASELPRWQIDAVDFSEAAVALARKNQQRLAIANADIFQSDWFSQIDTTKRYSVIVSNPPYIEADDHHLTEGDVRFEPLSALVAENNGLAEFKRIAADARNYLVDGGYLFLEHGFEQAIAVSEMLTLLGYDKVKTSQDLSGNDRITWATYNGAR